ncbi:hypothetical protein MHIP_59890 [Mycolicibacterium hippocampi]|uniref:Uncharacterized protein n=1 Tax=Mycolicibacterium hippocampi TaxID=659824 RepID=A0A7I9ZXR9_9MYCO|nr:hypothetical protein MHIP_59890 [Mycolicibacterium hippocampi]
MDNRLVEIAVDWTRGGEDGATAVATGATELRADAGGGDPDSDRYLLGLDPHAPETHSPLASAMMRVIADADRHPRDASGIADQRAPSAIAPGREWNHPTTPRRCRRPRT